MMFQRSKNHTGNWPFLHWNSKACSFQKQSIRAFYAGKHITYQKSCLLSIWQDKAKQNKKASHEEKPVRLVYPGIPLQVKYSALLEKQLVYISHHMHAHYTPATAQAFRNKVLEVLIYCEI